MNTYFQEIETFSKSNPDSSIGGYFGLFFLFLLIIGFGFWIIFFAKWLKYGPKFKRFGNKLKAKITGKADKSGPKVHKGAVISNEIQVTKIEDEIIQAKTPQELLAAQNRKIAYEKEVKNLEEKLAKDQAAVEAKEQAKQEIKDEKQKDKEEVAQAKKEKKDAKQEKKDKKGSEK